MTRAACRHHAPAFMAEYGHLTRAVPVNVYAVAAMRSMIDYQQFVQTLRSEVPFIEIHDPAEFGLTNVEGAVLTGERHIITDLAREEFRRDLKGVIRFGVGPGDVDDDFDWNVDCTFAANSAAGVDRYEPCLVALLEGDTSRAVTVMDGPFPSLYPWDETKGLLSLSSAQWTPFGKYQSYAQAKAVLDSIGTAEVDSRAISMRDQMAEFYPAVHDFRIAELRLSIRAMPLSGADSRLVDVQQDGSTIRVRAGKIDAIIAAEQEVRRIMNCG